MKIPKTPKIVKERPAEVSAAVVGTVSAAIIAELARFHVQLIPAEQALLILIIGWVAPVVTRFVSSRHA